MADKIEITQEELEKKIQDAIDAATKGLVSKKTELEKKISKRNQELADAETAKKTELEAAEQKKLEDEGKLNELVDRLRTQLQELKDENKITVDKLEDKFKKTDISFRELVVDNELTKQFIAAGVDDKDILEAVVALHTNKVEVVEVEGKMVARIEEGSIEDYVATWKDDKGKAFITASSSGGGGEGSKDKGVQDQFEQYFKDGSINLTKQNELKELDADRYNSLKEKYKKPADTRLTVGQIVN